MTPIDAEQRGLVLLHPKRINKLHLNQDFYITPRFSQSRKQSAFLQEVLATYSMQIEEAGLAFLQVVRYSPQAVIQRLSLPPFYPAGIIPIRGTLGPEAFQLDPTSCPVDFIFDFGIVDRKTYNALDVEMLYRRRKYLAHPNSLLGEYHGEQESNPAFLTDGWEDPVRGHSRPAFYPPDPEIIQAVRFRTSLRSGQRGRDSKFTSDPQKRLRLVYRANENPQDSA